MTTTRCTARKVYELETDATPEQIIALAEEISGGLDSADLGDAMGAFVEHLDTQSYKTASATIRSDDGLITVKIKYDWELFNWH